MTELTIKAGDMIKYSSGAGRLAAIVRSISIGPTAKPNHSIAWLNITTLPDPANGRKFASSFSIPADADSLKMYKVEVV
jgi:hypothetical protein